MRAMCILLSHFLLYCPLQPGIVPIRNYTTTTTITTITNITTTRIWVESDREALPLCHHEDVHQRCDAR